MQANPTIHTPLNFTESLVKLLGLRTRHTPQPSCNPGKIREELLEISEQTAVPATRVAIAALQEMRRDPAHADTIARLARRHIRAVQRCVSREIIQHCRSNRPCVHPEDAARVAREYRRAFQRTRAECVRAMTFVESHRLRTRTT